MYQTHHTLTKPLMISTYLCNRKLTDLQEMRNTSYLMTSIKKLGITTIVLCQTLLENSVLVTVTQGGLTFCDFPRLTNPFATLSSTTANSEE